MNKIPVTRQHLSSLSLMLMLRGQVEILTKISYEANLHVVNQLSPKDIKMLGRLIQKYNQATGAAHKDLEREDHRKLNHRSLAMFPREPRELPASLDELMSRNYDGKEILNYMILEIQIFTAFPYRLILNSAVEKEVLSMFLEQVFSLYKAKKWTQGGIDRLFDLWNSRHQDYYNVLETYRESKKLIPEMGSVAGKNIFGNTSVNEDFSRFALILGSYVTDNLKKYGVLFEDFELQG